MPKRKLITLSDRLDEMITQIKEDKGYSYASDVIKQAVIEMHAKMYPAYAVKGTKKDRQTPEEKAREKDRIKQEKLKIAHEKQLVICKKLDGKVKTNSNGNEVCIYYNYSGKTRFEQETPLDMLADDLVKTQYQPSKEHVKRLQKEKKVDY